MVAKTVNDAEADYRKGKSFLKSLKGTLEQYIAEMAAGDINRSKLKDEVLPLLQTAANRAATANAAQTAVAKVIEDDVTYDWEAEVAAIDTAVTGALTWIGTNYPKDANDWMQNARITDLGVITDGTLSSVQTAGLRTELQAIADLIE